MAAAPAAIAGADKLKGPRIRFKTSAMAGGQTAQPMRKAARPWIFENVRVITVFGVVATSSRPAS